MVGNRKDDALCLAALESNEQQLPGGPLDSSSRAVDDRDMAQLRQTLDQLPPTVSWEDIRSRILTALSDLPDERRPCVPFARHVPAVAHVGRRQCSAKKEPGIWRKECFKPTSQGSPCFPHLLRAPWRIHKIVWTMSAIVLMLIMPLLLYHSNPRNIFQHVSPPPPQTGAAPSTSPQVRPATAEAAAPAARGPATITAVQHEFTLASATVVITLTGPANYEVHRLAKPERVYIDFHDTRASPRLDGTTFVVGKPCLRKYRLASHTRQVARIAFETGIACDYSAKLTAAPSTSLVLLLRPMSPTGNPNGAPSHSQGR